MTMEDSGARDGIDPALAGQMRGIEIKVLAEDVRDLCKWIRTSVISDTEDHIFHLTGIVAKWARVLAKLELGSWSDGSYESPDWLALEPKADPIDTAADIWRNAVMQRIRGLVRRFLQMAGYCSEAVSYAVELEENYAAMLHTAITSRGDTPW
jgi:hypothetical protein